MFSFCDHPLWLAYLKKGGGGMFGNMKEHNIWLSWKLMKQVSPHGKMILIIVKICRCHQSAPQQNIFSSPLKLPFITLYSPWWSSFIAFLLGVVFTMVLNCVLAFVLSLMCSSLFSYFRIGPCTCYGAYLVFLLSCQALGSLWCSSLSFCLHSRPCAKAISLLLLPLCWAMCSPWSSFGLLTFVLGLVL